MRSRDKLARGDEEDVDAGESRPISCRLWNRGIAREQAAPDGIIKPATSFVLMQIAAGLDAAAWFVGIWGFVDFQAGDRPLFFKSKLDFPHDVRM